MASFNSRFTATAMSSLRSKTSSNDDVVYFMFSCESCTTVWYCHTVQVLVPGTVVIGDGSNCGVNQIVAADAPKVDENSNQDDALVLL